jgi:two-component system sensor histidine kinase GlrK
MESYLKVNRRPLTIFARLILGNVLILLIATVVSVYAIQQLRQMRKITGSIVQFHNVMIELDREMTAALLSEVRYERKFSLLHDQALYRGFLASKSDFDTSLGQARAMATSPKFVNALKQVQLLNAAYQALFEEEVAAVAAGKSGARNRSQADKKRVADQAMEELAQLRALSQQRILQKLKELDQAEARASTAALVILAAALFVGVVVSVWITRSITTPLSHMKKKTAEVARGIFLADLEVASPPEIQALAGAFNTMCVKLGEVERLKSDFYSLMSHELRTPLTSIREGADMLLEGIAGEVGGKQRELLVIMSEESSRLLLLVGRLLELSKLESGALPFNFAQAELSPLISRIVRELSPLAAAKGIEIVWHGEEIPPLPLDAERILQVLRNLLGNALKFTPQGGTVRVTLARAEAEVAVSVADSGPGIARDEADIVFEKFRQASAGLSPRFQGTGLGLAIVKHIVEAHGGRVWVESEIGLGSCFTFVLPARSLS